MNNTQFPTLGNLYLKFDIYLEFGFCPLEFLVHFEHNFIIDGICPILFNNISNILIGTEEIN
jgi:hypothetical protein